MTHLPALNLTHLHLDRLPGIRTAFAVRAQPGVNLVVGPNEAGKSSLARTVFQLLWPQAPVATPFSVRGEFRDAVGPLQAHRDDNGPVTWTRHDGPTPAPETPGEHVSPCYRLGLLDLNRRDAGDLDNHLAQEIRRQMAGGFDLAQVRELFPDQSGKLIRQSREWNKARLELQQCQNQQKQLAEKERGIAGQEAEQDRARMAAQRADQLKTAQEIHTLTARESQLTKQRADLPPALAQVREGDHVDLLALQERLNDKSQQVQDLQGDIRQRTDRIEALLVTGNLAELAAFVKQAEALAARTDESARLRAAAANAVDDARQKIAPELLTARIPAASTEAFVRLAQAHQELTTRQARVDHLVRILDLEMLREDSANEAATDRSATSGLLLSERLTAPTKRPLFGGYLGLAAAVTMLVFGQSQPDYSVLANRLYGAGLVFGLWSAGVLGQWFRNQRTHKQACRQLEDRCRADGRPLPANWTRPEALAGFLAAAHSSGEDAGAERARTALQKELRRHLEEAQATLATAEGQRRELLRDLEQDQNRPAPGLLEDLDRVARCRTLEGQHEAARGAHEYNRVELAKVLTTGQNRLAEMKPDTKRRAEPASVITLQAGLDNLRQRQVQVEGLQEAQASAEKNLRVAQHELTTDHASGDAILTRLGLPTLTSGTALNAVSHEVVNQVLAWVDTLPDFKKLTQELASLRHGLARLKAQLSAVEGLPDPELVLAMTDVEREKQLTEEHRLAAGAEELTADIARIKALVDVARNSDEWEKARANEAELAADLNELQESERIAVLGRLLVKTIEKRHEDDTQPPLLTEMNQHLALFTGGRYQLRVTGNSGGEQRFVAVDNTDRPLELPELSDGTRAQLLLAARLAFLVRSEAGQSLPLFLDEALTASDPSRFDSIAGALGELAVNTGRQIFYLTSNPSDVAAWKRSLAQRNLPTPHVIDLAQERNIAAGADATLDLVDLPTVPRPQGLTSAEYGAKLGVPALQPWDHENTVHLFHLWKDDLELVHNLLQGGPATLGQWQQLGTKLVRAGMVSKTQAVRIDARGQVYGAFLDTWRVGRGKPLTREALVESGAVSSKLMPSALDLLKATNGNTRAFMLGVHDGEVKRLNKAKKEALQDFLERHGFWDDRDVWPPEHIVTHVLDAVSERLSDGSLTPDEVRGLVLDLYRVAQSTTHHSAESNPTD